jgi:Protein of unknown function (DUF2911)
MKKKIFIGLGLVLLVFVGYVAYTLLFPKSPKATASFNEGGLDISVSYSQPSKRGRIIFGEGSEEALQPYGEYWRLGANAPTEITFNKNITFAGKPVNAGTYRMYAVPGPASFQISLNSEIGLSGAGEPDYSKDVVKVDLPVTTTPSITEMFVIKFSKEGEVVNMDFAWDNVLVRVPITAQ